MRLDHVAIPVTDVGRAKEFYLQAFAPFGVRVVGEYGPLVVLSGDGGAFVALNATGDYRGPGHVAISTDRAGVDAFHAAALAAGGEDNGAPGVREHYHPNY